MVDISKIKVGDKVTVEFTVKHLAGVFYGASYSCSSYGHGDYGIFADQIVAHTPKPIEPRVGAKFKAAYAEGSTIYTIVQIDGDNVVYTWKDTNSGNLSANVASIAQITAYMTQHPTSQDD